MCNFLQKVKFTGLGHVYKFVQMYKICYDGLGSRFYKNMKSPNFHKGKHMKNKKTNHKFDLYRFNNMSILNNIKGINIGISTRAVRLGYKWVYIKDYFKDSYLFNSKSWRKIRRSKWDAICQSNDHYFQKVS